MNVTSLSSMELQARSMKNCLLGNMVVVPSVNDLLRLLRLDLPWSMTIEPSKSGDLPVLTVIGTSLDDTVTAVYSDVLPTILIEGLVSSFLHPSSVDELKERLSNEDR